MAENNKNQELEDLAGEYVLGTLTGEERLHVEELMRDDPAMARAVACWQGRLSPLALAQHEVAPPEQGLEAVLAKIDKLESETQGQANANENANRQTEKQDSGQVIALNRKIAFWSRSAVLAGAMAASLLVFIALNDQLISGPQQPFGSYVAVLQGDDKSPQFVASIDLAQGKIDLVRLGQKPKADKDYELWALGGGRKKPVSLGVIDLRNGGSKVRLEAELDGEGRTGVAETVFAISLEPLGGSPTGQPTGPVLFTGKLVPLQKAGAPQE